ncbi:MAG: hypothetical protein AB7U07_16255 [Thermoleophilia bacterium]
MAGWLSVRGRVVCGFVAGAALASAATAATADKLLTGADIKNGTVSARDLAPGRRARPGRRGR